MRSIQLEYCRIDYEPGKSINTVFDNGREWGACPGTDPHYSVIAHRCGYQDDLWRYAFEHDFCHHFLAERLCNTESRVIFSLASGGRGSRFPFFEECLVQTFQAFLRANQRPIIGDVDWDGLKVEALRLLDAPTTSIKYSVECRSGNVV